MRSMNLGPGGLEQAVSPKTAKTANAVNFFIKMTLYHLFRDYMINLEDDKPAFKRLVRHDECFKEAGFGCAEYR